MKPKLRKPRKNKFHRELIKRVDTLYEEYKYFVGIESRCRDVAYHEHVAAIAYREAKSILDEYEAWQEKRRGKYVL